MSKKTTQEKINQILGESYLYLSFDPEQDSKATKMKTATER